MRAVLLAFLVGLLSVGVVDARHHRDNHSISSRLAALSERIDELAADVELSLESSPESEAIIDEAEAQSPWFGKWKPSGRCDQSSCCCPSPSGIVEVSASPITQSLLQAKLTAVGRCPPLTPKTFTFPAPSGTSLEWKLLGLVDFSLTVNAGTVTMIDKVHPKCGETFSSA